MKALKHPYKGEMLTCREIAERTGLTLRAIQHRVRKGLDFDMPYRFAKHCDYNGQNLSVAEIAKIKGLSKESVYRRLRKNQDLGKPRNMAQEYDFCGEKKTAKEIMKAVKSTSYTTIYKHLTKAGVTLGKQPRKRRRVLYKGEMRTTHEIAELDGITYGQAAKIVRALRK